MTSKNHTPQTKPKRTKLDTRVLNRLGEDKTAENSPTQTKSDTKPVCKFADGVKVKSLLSDKDNLEGISPINSVKTAGIPLNLTQSANQNKTAKDTNSSEEEFLKEIWMDYNYKHFSEVYYKICERIRSFKDGDKWIKKEVEKQLK